jgi:hypothetical protein|tara:strand:+ start:731 stop:973 length:243 start_codon:yes stop_codon:yes gene_type:complete
MKLKIGLGLSVFLGSLLKLLFFTKKPPKLHQNTKKYTRKKSDKDYVEVDRKGAHPFYDYQKSYGRNSPDDNVIRSPDGSA